MSTASAPSSEPIRANSGHPWLRAARTGFDCVLDLLYPPKCLLCEEMGAQYVCDDCAYRLFTPLPEPVCRRCGHPLTAPRCRHCAERPPAFTRALATSEYAGDLRLTIHLLKYRDKPMLAEPLGRLLAEFAMEERRALHNLEFDAVVPVPMHPARRRLRGYNHAERLAWAFAGEVGLSMDSRLLRRMRNTHPQVGFEREKRLANLAGAFAAHPNRCAGKTVLLIDDVSTTGSTLHECAVALKSAGAKAVYCLTLAVG